MSVRHAERTSSNGVFWYKAAGFLLLGIIFLPAIPFLQSVYATTSGLALDETELQLLVIPTSSKLPADRNSYDAMIQLQVVDNENPIEAPQDIDITIVTSDPSVISVPQNRATIQKGESMTRIELASTDKAGVASITAQAEGVRSSSAAVTTYRMDSLEPTRLDLNAAPSILIPDPHYPGLIYLQVLNSQNLPAVSKNDISVDISSSIPTVARVPTYAVIPAGSSGIVLDVTPQKQTGETTIKASAPGLAPGEATVTVDGPIASQLRVEFAPDIIPAVNYYDSMMSIQLTDENDEPVKAPQLTRVLLKSSDTSIVEVPNYVEISEGRSHVIAFVEAKGKVGVVTITASATGYGTGINTIESVPMSTIGTNDPKQLRLFSAPSILPPDNSEHQSMVIAFQDMEGKPYRQTSYLFQRIALSTSNTQVGELSGLAYIGKETYAIAKFTTKHAIGETEITASLEGHQPAQMELVVGGAGPARVEVSQMPRIVPADNFASQSLVLNLVDHNGLPVASHEDTIVYLSSSNPEITKVQASVTIPAGDSYVKAEVQPTLRAGATTITAAANGLEAGSVEFRTAGFSGSISEYHLGLNVIPNLPADGREYDAISIQLQDQAGLPVLAKSDVMVTLSSGSLNAGSVQQTLVIPKGANVVVVSYRTSLVPSDMIKITASSEGYTSVDAELKTTTQPLTVFKTSEFPSKAGFNEEITVSVDVYSGAIPVSGATVAVTGANAQTTTTLTDENGHAQGHYVPTLPGSNTIVVEVSKPGYEDEEIRTRITLQQTVDLTIVAKTEGDSPAPAILKVSVPPGVRSQTMKANVPLAFDDVNWGSYTINAPLEAKTANARYEFVGWSDGSTENPRAWNVVENSEIAAIYKAEYLLQISDVNGLSTGSGYYAEGSTATISMTTTSIPGALTDKEFGGWTGSVKSTSKTVDVLMDGPKSITAEWRDNFLKLILIGAAVGGAGFFYYWKILVPKRVLAEKERAPDLDWYKS